MDGNVRDVLKKVLSSGPADRGTARQTEEQHRLIKLGLIRSPGRDVFHFTPQDTFTEQTWWRNRDAPLLFSDTGLTCVPVCAALGRFCTKREGMECFFVVSSFWWTPRSPGSLPASLLQLSVSSSLLPRVRKSIPWAMRLDRRVNYRWTCSSRTHTSLT